MKNLGRNILTLLNKLIPKFNQAIIIPFPDTESGAIAVANYISKNSEKSVYYVLTQNKSDLRHLFSPKVKFIYRKSRYDLTYLLKVMCSKYVFFTHGVFLNTFSKKQKVINLWHGLLYKKVCVLLGKEGISADITVGTSELTQKMLSEAFGVPLASVTDTGYPRNDILINANLMKEKIRNRINTSLNDYYKMVVWMPTYRNTVKNAGEYREDGNEVGNPFYIENFDVEEFDTILKKSNSICFVKPHPSAPKYDSKETLTNIVFIDDAWIACFNISLYDFLGSSDILISDVSSVIIDYMLLDQPIVCISTDYDAYKDSRGFYFEDLEEWMPSKILKNQEEFFRYISLMLFENIDPFENKRKELKRKFFKYRDNMSTRRLIESIKLNE